MQNFINECLRMEPKYDNLTIVQMSKSLAAVERNREKQKNRRIFHVHFKHLTMGVS